MDAVLLSISALVLWMVGLGLRDRAELEKSVGKMALASIILICTLFSALVGLNRVYGRAGSLADFLIITCVAAVIFVSGFVQSWKWIRKASN